MHEHLVLPAEPAEAFECRVRLVGGAERALEAVVPEVIAEHLGLRLAGHLGQPDCVVVHPASLAVPLQEGRERLERLVEPRRVAPGAEDLELSGRAVEPRLDPPHETVTFQDRQDVVAVLALR